MSTSQPPTEEAQLENINIVPDAQVVDRSLSEVVLTSASPATEIATSVMSASTETPVYSSQIHDLARPSVARQSFSSGARPRQNMPLGGNQQSPSQTVSPHFFYEKKISSSHILFDYSCYFWFGA
jgi:hypothetical protein